MRILVDHSLDKAPLGKQSEYIDYYTPGLLFPLLRVEKRDELGINSAKLPFMGVDRWTGYEVSWLNLKGKPEVAVVEFIFNCHSEYLIESKSFKIYLNSFNNSKFDSYKTVLAHLEKDLTAAVKSKVFVKLLSSKQATRNQSFDAFEGECLDKLDVSCSEYMVNNALIKTDSEKVVTESIYSNLLKSNCLVTGQPDWGSVWISYEGQKIHHESLLQYIVSFRNHNEFHEQCVERIFIDIMNKASPAKLSVYACYTRRGGLDINPFRSTHLIKPPMIDRLFRQ